MSMTLSAAVQVFREKWPDVHHQPEFPEKLAELSRLTGRTITRDDWLAEMRASRHLPKRVSFLPASAFSVDDSPPAHPLDAFMGPPQRYRA